MKDSILIIGATGSVGFEVATRLIEKNKSVKIAVRDPERAKSINIKGAEFVHFEYSTPETYDKAFDGVKKVLIVSPPSYLNLQDKVISAIDKATSNGVELIVNISAISIDSPLDKPMKMIEDHIKNSGIKYILLRPNCYMQNFKDLFRDLIVEENQISVPAENSKICFIDIRDVAEVAVKVLIDDSLKNNVYHLTGNKKLNMHVVAHIFSEELGKEIEYENIPEEKFEKMLRMAGWPAGTIEGTKQLCHHVKKGETDIITDDVKKILGRDPISFNQFVRDYADNWS